MTLGLECIKFMLEQDPANLPIVQRWIDKWTWRGTRKLGAIGMMMDYMLPKRVMSWKEAWEIYFEQNGGALWQQRDSIANIETCTLCHGVGTLADVTVIHPAFR